MFRQKLSINPNFFMSYYLLPKIGITTYKFIDCIDSDEWPAPIISNSLSLYLYDIKEKLERRDKEWDVFKKYTNPYEYIHTVIPFKKKSVSKYKPLSRSYFKMIEMIHVFDLQFDSKPINSFHLAEGPGGFIEALARTRNFQYDKYVGMTILDDMFDSGIPGWKKTEAFLRQRKNVSIESGIDGTGNILSLANLVYCKEKYHASMDLITADGGFDFSIDFNSQEIHIAKLLFGQVCFALSMQKKGGTFILKVFDCFMQHSLDILYILSSFYEKTYMIKPNTSRFANSEKYIVCKGFLHSSCESFFPVLHRAFEKMVEPTASSFVHRFLTIPLAYSFTTKVEEYNSIFGQQQIENIHYTISLIENKHKQDKIDHLIKSNIQKCIQWCVRNHVEYNMLFTTANIFLNSPTADPELLEEFP